MGACDRTIAAHDTRAPARSATHAAGTCVPVVGLHAVFRPVDVQSVPRVDALMCGVARVKPFTCVCARHYVRSCDMSLPKMTSQLHVINVEK